MISWHNLGQFDRILFFVVLLQLLRIVLAFPVFNEHSRSVPFSKKKSSPFVQKFLRHKPYVTLDAISLSRTGASFIPEEVFSLRANSSVKERHGLRRSVEAGWRVRPVPEKTVHLNLTGGTTMLLPNACTRVYGSDAKMEMPRRKQSGLEALQVAGKLLFFRRFNMRWSFFHDELHLNRNRMESSLWANVQE